MNEPEPTYVMAKPPKADAPKKRINWRQVLLQVIETAGVGLVAAGAGLYEPYLGFIVFGAWLVYVANT